MNQILTLGAIRDAGPCGIDRNETRTGFRLRLHSLGEPDVGYNRDRRVSLGDIAVSNGADDAWWCVRVIDWSDVTVRRAVIAALLPAVRRAAAHTTDERVHSAVVAVARWVAGDDAVDLAAAGTAAWAAARAAAGTAAWAAARAAAWAVAWAVAWDAAWAAAGAAAGTAAWAVAGAADRTQQAADIITAFPPLWLADAP